MLNQTETEEIAPELSGRTTQDLQMEPVSAPVCAAPASEDLKNLARKISSRKPAEREAAQQMLEVMPIPMILSLMAYQRQQRKARYFKIGMVFLAYCVLLGVMAYFVHRSIPLNFWMFISFGASGAAFTKVQKSGAMALAQRADLTVVGELICALEMRDKEVQEVIRPALVRLLPQVRSSDASLLDRESTRVLRQFMEGTIHGRQFKRQRTTDDTALLVAILKALEQVGDETFIPIVTRWAEGDHRGAIVEVRDAAIECLPYLKSLSARRKAGAELLRASRAEIDHSGETLLRAASGANTAQADELLRSAGTAQPSVTSADGNPSTPSI